MFKKIWYNKKRLLKYFFPSTATQAGTYSQPGSDSESSDDGWDNDWGNDGWFEHRDSVDVGPFANLRKVDAIEEAVDETADTNRDTDTHALCIVRFREVHVSIELGVIVGVVSLDLHNVLFRGVSAMAAPRKSSGQLSIEKASLQDMRSGQRTSTVHLKVVAEDIVTGTYSGCAQSLIFVKGGRS